MPIRGEITTRAMGIRDRAGAKRIGRRVDDYPESSVDLHPTATRRSFPARCIGSLATSIIPDQAPIISTRRG